MKFEWNKKYAQVAFWVCLVVLFTVICVFFFMNYNNFGAYADNFISVINPILYGIVIAYILNKIMKIYETKVFKFLDKKEGKARLKRTLSILCTYLTAVAFIVLFILLLVPQIIAGITDLAVNIPFYIDAIYEWIYDMADLNSTISDMLMSAMEYLDELYDQFDEIIAAIVPQITEWLSGMVTFVLDLVIGIILSVYFLMQKERFIAQGKRLAKAVFQDGGYGRAVKLMKDIDNSFGGYLVAMGVDSLLVMCECFVLFGLCGIPYYPLISFIIGVTNFIPFFGPFIGAIPSAIIIFIADPMKVLIFIVLILLIQQIDGNIIAPRIIGSHIGISSVWVVIAVTLMSGFFGFIGMVIGVPLFSVIYTVIDNAIADRLEKKNCDTEIFDFYSEDNMGKTMEIEMMRAEERKAQNPSFFDKIFAKFKPKKHHHKHDSEKYTTGETTVTVQEFSTEEFMASYENTLSDEAEAEPESEEDSTPQN